MPARLTTGQRVRVAVIDSGIYADHPHVGGIAGGIAIDAAGRRHLDYVDRIGHGTAVAAAIREKAPEAELYAVKVFDHGLSTEVGRLVRAIEWAADAGMHLANLSLGTPRYEHEPVLRRAVGYAASRQLLIVAACDDEGVRYLPGSLPGVLPVQVDWTCPRDQYRALVVEGRTLFRASGLPREIPGVAPARNLSGISFAVANMTGLVARALAGSSDPCIGMAVDALVGGALVAPDAAESVDFTGKV